MQVTFPNVNPCSQAVEGTTLHVKLGDIVANPWVCVAGNPMVPVDHFSVPNSIGMWIVPDIIPSLYAGPAYMVKNESRAGPQPARDIIKTLQEYDNPLPADEGIIKLEGEHLSSLEPMMADELTGRFRQREHELAVRGRIGADGAHESGPELRSVTGSARHGVVDPNRHRCHRDGRQVHLNHVILPRA